MLVEEKIVEDICSRVVNRLLGRSDEFRRILDNKPESVFFVGMLQPKNSERNYKSIINPNSIGLDFVLIKRAEAIKIDVDFSVYYRVYPTFNEQKYKIVHNSDVREVWKRKNLKLKFVCELKEGNYDFSDELMNNMTKELIHDFLNGKYYDRLYRGSGNKKFNPEVHLRSEKDYQEYLNSRNGKEYHKNLIWDIRLKVGIKRLKNNEFKVKIELTNDTINYSKRFSVFSPVIFDPKIKTYLMGNNIKYQELEFMKTEAGAKIKIPARGINCSAKFNYEQNTIETEIIPIHKQKRLKPSITVYGYMPTFRDLSVDPIPILEGIHSKMEELYDKCKHDIDEKKSDEIKNEINRFLDGINFIKRDKDALKAFKLVNKTMLRAANRDGSWYLFQIVFIVSNLKAVVGEEFDKVEVIRVPTGGGKTWTYLGLVLFSVFYKRLIGEKFGCVAWIKFPLRMLSLQQLEIVSKFMSYANKVKEEHNIPGDPISVGYLVGSKNTPNRFDKGLDWLKSGRDFRVVTQCPFCSGEVRLIADKNIGRIYHKCEKCNEILPILVVDNEIFRFIPSVIVSTIDKAAILNYNYRAKNLFGGKVAECIKGYGYRYFGENWCIYGDINWKNKDNVDCTYFDKSKCKLNKYIKGNPPILLIQDELHMIRELDGCLNSHLEGIIENVIKEYGGRGLKVVAPTATAAGVERQIQNLYFGKSDRIFPSFKKFYFGEKDEIHRISVGILPVRRAINWATWHVIKEIEKAIQELTEEYKNDKDKLNKLLELYSIILAYHRSKRDANELKSGLGGIINEELQKEKYKPIPINKTELVTGERSLDQLRELMDKITSKDDKKKIKLISSTLIISHGIDFDELNIMVFRGMPRSVSEYEQARSRVGRKFPSLIFVIHHGNLIRDQSFYKYFSQFHENVNEYIENIPLYRWASKSIELMSPSAVLSILHSYYIDIVEINSSLMKCSEFNYYISKDKIEKMDLINKAVEYLYLKYGAPSKFLNKFQKDVKNMVDIIMNTCLSQQNKQIAKICDEQKLPIYNLKNVEKEIEIYPTKNAQFIESKANFEKEPSYDARLSSAYEEIEDISEGGDEE